MKRASEQRQINIIRKVSGHVDTSIYKHGWGFPLGWSVAMDTRQQQEASDRLSFTGVTICALASPKGISK